MSLCAEDGEAALTLAAAKKPDLIVMDVAMPGMDGCEATRRLRAMPELTGVVILACSAGLSESRRQACIAAGCDDFLAKPIDAKSLLDQIGQRLGLVWVQKEMSAAAPTKTATPDDEALHLPSAEALGLLLGLADQGRLQELEQHADELAREDPRLGPWVRGVRALTNAFALDELSTRLRADAAAASASYDPDPGGCPPPGPRTRQCLDLCGETAQCAVSPRAVARPATRLPAKTVAATCCLATSSRSTARLRAVDKGPGTAWSGVEGPDPLVGFGATPQSPG